MTLTRVAQNVLGVLKGRVGTVMGGNWAGAQLPLARLGAEASLKRGRLTGGLKGEGLPR